jgi:hypothetical protein
MTLYAQKCIELIDKGLLTVDRIINPAVKAEVQSYYDQKAQQTTETTVTQ